MSRCERMDGVRGRTSRFGMFAAAAFVGLSWAVALEPLPLAAQGATSSRANDLFFPGGPGGGSSSGRFLSDLSTGPRTGPRSRSSEARRVERVPINVRTMADGTAGTIRPQPRERRRNVGGAIVPNGPVYQYLYPTTSLPSAYYRTAPATGIRTAAPSEGVGRRAPAGRLPRVPAGSEDDRGTGEPSSTEPVPSVPMIQPPAGAADGLRIAPDDCVEVRITTAGGIEWRNRVSLAGLGAESARDAHRAIQATFERGEALTLEGLDGRFDVRSGQVQGYIVGPCASVAP